MLAERNHNSDANKPKKKYHYYYYIDIDIFFFGKMGQFVRDADSSQNIVMQDSCWLYIST